MKATASSAARSLARHGSKLLLVILVVSFATASTMSVKPIPLTLIYAEHYSVGNGFVAGPSKLTPAFADLAAHGDDGNPVGIASSMPDARTAVVTEHWVYSILIKESMAGAVPGGNYSVALTANGVDIGKVFIAKVGSATGGVRASFDIGAELPSSTLFYLVVAPVVRTGPIVEFTIISKTPDKSIWVGVGGTIDGVTNPALTVPMGATLRLTARNADDVAHNVGIKDAPGALVTAWSADIEKTGDTVVLMWTPSAAGTYSYPCKYHAATQNGLIVVT
ncbi:MAG: cupredoxin domain-containing protein [Candidatus Thermoplasmatota archaeon]